MVKAKPSNTRSVPLERSSNEFMVAMGFAAITQLIPDWTVYLLCWVAIAGVAIYFCLCSRGTVDYGGWRKFFLSVCCITAIFSMAYSQVLNRYREANVIPPTVKYMTYYGEDTSRPGLQITGIPPKVISGEPSSLVIVDGRLLTKYQKKFQLMAVLYHTMNNESYMDKKELSKSGLIKIRAEDMLLKIEYNAQFLEEIERYANNESFALLAIPAGMKPEDFDTLNEAEDKGAQIIDQGSKVGPPATLTPINNSSH
jgi:hypothetical protein